MTRIRTTVFGRAALYGAAVATASWFGGAQAQDAEAQLAACADLGKAPGVVAEACWGAAENADLPLRERASAAFRAGAAYAKIEKLQEAEAAYSVALDFEPDFAEAYSGRARVRERLDDIAAAAEDHDAAVRLKPDDPLTVYARGVFHFRQDDETKARADLYRALDLDPDAAWPYVYLGAIHDLAGADDLALQQYEAAFRIDTGILTQFQISMESQGFDPGFVGEYDDVTRASLIECMRIDCVIGESDN